MTNKRISVVMTVYNGSRFLASALESILEQSYPEIEFIVVDDGSTDDSPEIVKSYDDPRIRYFENKQNRGQSYSRNLAIHKATGAYIAIMDADDVSYPCRLKKQVEFLEANPEISICGSAVTLIDEAGKPVGLRKTPPDDGTIKLKLLFGCPIVHPSVMWRKFDFLRHDLWYDEDFVYAQDFELWTRAMWHLKFHNIEEPLLAFRFRNSNSISFSKVHEQKAYASKVVARNMTSLMKVGCHPPGRSFFQRVKFYQSVVDMPVISDDRQLKVEYFRTKILGNRVVPRVLRTRLRELLIR